MVARNGNDDSQQPLDGEYIPAAQGDGKHKRRRFRLTDARGVRRELAGLYHELRNGELDLNTAKAAGFLLRCLLESIRTDDIEQRITELERKSR